jgi:signal transduction histidine kinase/CheY-like chemotaxis protein
MDRDAGKSDRTRKIVLVAVNVILVTAILLLCSYHVEKHYKNEIKNAKTSFGASASSVRRVAGISLMDAQRACDDSAAWINTSEYDMDKALYYLDKANTVKKGMSCIISYDTLKGYSSKPNKNGVRAVDYSKISNTIEPVIYLLKNESNDNNLFITSSFTNPVTYNQAVAFCQDVKIKEADGAFGHYLLLRVLEISDLNEKWIFPKMFENGELSLINSAGNYIIRSKSMKKKNFWEFVRIYNKVGYDGASKIRTDMYHNNGEVRILKNSSGENSYFVCIPFDDQNSDLYYIGYLSIKSIKASKIDYTLIFIVAFGMLMILVVNGSNILAINKKLKRSTEEAREANMAKTKFLSSMSHDIRTPMNAIIGLTTIASRYTNDPEKITECLDKITIASNHLLTLINDILDISKIESGKITLNPTAFSLKECINSQLDIVKSQAKEKNLELVTDMNNIEYEYLYADELRINQIFINLLTNAIKYTNFGGKISVGITEEKENINSDNVNLTYTVRDNGVGMTEDFMKIMYDSFSRVSDTRTDKIQGSGLGLAITRQMVELMGGTIECQSEVGCGTVFTVKLSLPIAKIEDVDQNEKIIDGENDDISGMNVLVAEDNNINWEIINEMLSLYKIKSTRAENGKICVDLLTNKEKNTYDMILMDVQMPIMNGLEATRAIRQLDDKEKSSIPIIAMTADAFAEDIQACLDAGMNAHVPKPVDLNKMIDVIIRVRKRGKA